MSYIATCRAGLAALQAKKEVNILAIESSCDETAAAVIQNGRKILSSAVFTQIPLHAVYGGVVPEIASRAHVDAVDRMVDYALNEAGMKLRDVDAIGVTYGPGLVGALLTGVETRSSSPVRILRGEDLQSNLKGIFPCGEGAGYAGGIMSAAVDGIRASFRIMEEFNSVRS